MAFRDKMGVALKEMHESLGDVGTIATIQEMLDKGEIKPSDFSLQELWHTFERDSSGMVKSYSEAVSSDMFPKITGELINITLIKAYDAVAGIGDSLCTTVSSKMEIETYGGFTAVEMPEEVQQGKAYNDSSVGEKYTQISHTKYGRIISVTEEMIYFDKTGQILMRAARIGTKAAQYRERLIVEGIQDINGTVFKPQGIATAYYRTAASGDRKINSKASTPFGEAGLKEAFKLMHQMTDENGDYVLIDPASVIALMPYDLMVEAAQMQKSTLVPEGNENAVNIWKGMFTPYTSPYVTAQSTSTWFIGSPKDDFVWSEVWPLQTFTAKPGHEDEFNRDIKSKHKVRFFGNIGCLDDKHMYKFTA